MCESEKKKKRKERNDKKRKIESCMLTGVDGLR